MSEINPPIHEEFNYPDFSSVGGLKLVGNAHQSKKMEASGRALRLTLAQGDRRGSAWFAVPMPVASGFITGFQFRVSEAGGIGGGADGFSFNVHDLGNDQLVGETGTASRLSIQFDTFRNDSEGDRSDNFVRVNYLGEAVAERDLNGTNPPMRMKDGDLYQVRITFLKGMLSVDMEKASNWRSPIGIISGVSVDLSTFSSAFVGFGARTGGGWANHDILSWEFKCGSRIT